MVCGRQATGRWRACGLELLRIHDRVDHQPGRWIQAKWEDGSDYGDMIRMIKV
ncbi:uncharacterized protein BDW47DRAFT_99962 [Aspergillus candidus]|uniref:Uncharacterized protein n=1 Tax=Aspergillus candidus TaxID=41067 RepID=A0A2I2FL45_ASPCN|nr:hypothetical protein BDW47DRAFT_99962 [Aspergillus candidus]PLB41342.1 hypothetical protein BDW47DRAFT_99962 [Aspergillus candidus]